MAKKHYHLMNGSFGCIPDNNEVHSSIKSALDSARNLFSDVSEGFIADLRRNRIHQFTNNYGEAGADYVEISDPCYDPNCLED